MIPSRIDQGWDQVMKKKYSKPNLMLIRKISQLELIRKTNFHSPLNKLNKVEVVYIRSDYTRNNSCQS